MISKIKLCGFYVVLFAVSLFVPFLPSSDVKAQSLSIEKTEFDFHPDWATVVKEKLPEFNPKKGSMVILRTNITSSNWAIVIWSPQKQLKLHYTYNLRLLAETDYYYFQISSKHYFPNNMNIVKNSDQYINNGNGGSISNYIQFNNIGYTPEYLNAGGKKYENTKLPGETDEKDACSALDVVCWIGDFSNSVVDGFQSLAKIFTDAISGLGNWIANLIMPKNDDGSFNNRFTDFFTTMQQTLNQRLGILLFPFDFIASFFAKIDMIRHNNVVGTDGKGCQAPALTIPKLLGNNDVNFHICAIEDKMPKIYTAARAIANLAWTIGLIAFLHKKYFDIVKGGESV